MQRADGIRIDSDPVVSKEADFDEDAAKVFRAQGEELFCDETVFRREHAVGTEIERLRGKSGFGGDPIEEQNGQVHRGTFLGRETPGVDGEWRVCVSVMTRA